MVPKPDHAKAFSLQELSSFRITGCIRVLTAIDLNHQTGAATNEVYNVAANWFLAAKTLAVQLAGPNARPQQLFRLSRLAAQAPAATNVRWCRQPGCIPRNPHPRVARRDALPSPIHGGGLVAVYHSTVSTPAVATRTR